MKIIYDEKICVKCLACVTESEFGGVTFERGRIFFDETCPEDWENIFAICPVAAIKSNVTLHPVGTSATDCQSKVVAAIKKSATEVTDNVSKFSD
ncbi:MAG: hypothetical protein IJ685_01385 [Selenomonadaceae bacterium]|nr:hypothetical protein [Selenomonadaceae bacterium]